MPLTPHERETVNETAAAAFHDHAAELVEAIASFIETWGNTPPNPTGRRAELARDVRCAFMPANPTGTTPKR